MSCEMKVTRSPGSLAAIVTMVSLCLCERLKEATEGTKDESLEVEMFGLGPRRAWSGNWKPSGSASQASRPVMAKGVWIACPRSYDGELVRSEVSGENVTDLLIAGDWSPENDLDLLRSFRSPTPKVELLGLFPSSSLTSCAKGEGTAITGTGGGGVGGSVENMIGTGPPALPRSHSHRP